MEQHRASARLERVRGHLDQRAPALIPELTAGSSPALPLSDDDIVIVSYVGRSLARSALVEVDGTVSNTGGLSPRQ